jgi:hypothetical protein
VFVVVASIGTSGGGGGGGSAGGFGFARAGHVVDRPGARVLDLLDRELARRPRLAGEDQPGDDQQRADVGQPVQAVDRAPRRDVIRGLDEGDRKSKAVERDLAARAGHEGVRPAALGHQLGDLHGLLAGDELARHPGDEPQHRLVRQSDHQRHAGGVDLRRQPRPGGP